MKRKYSFGGIKEKKQRGCFENYRIKPSDLMNKTIRIKEIRE